MRNTIEQLMLYTKEKRYENIKSILNYFDARQKGKLLELFLVELYKGNGYIAERKGGKDDVGADVLIYHPSDAEQVFMIIQAKNNIRPLAFNDARSELVKFEQDGQVKYKCSNYTLVSINGYVSDCKRLTKTNMKLKSWDYIISLIDTYDENNKCKSPRIELFAHNDIAYEQVKEIWNTSNKVAVVQATGTGKSYVILQLLLDYYTENKIVIAPSKYIFKQFKEKVSWAVHKTKFITYQKLAKMTDIDIASLSPSLIIFDEMHRIGAETWEKGYVNLVNSFPDAKLAGFSATPIRYLDNSRDISKDIFEGNTTTELSLTRAIAEKILPMPIYISSLYTLEQEIDNKKQQVKDCYCTDIEKNNFIKELNNIKLTWEKIYGVSTILKKYIQDKQNSMKFIVFCSDKKHLNKMRVEIEKWFIEAFPQKIIKKYIVVSGMAGEKQELQDFINSNNRNTISLLLSVDKLNEGLHIKGVTGVILLRKTESPTVFYQQIGRAIAVESNAPLIFDLVNNFANIKIIDFEKDLVKSIDEERKYRNDIGIDYVAPEITVFDEIKQSEKLFGEIELKLKNLWEYRFNQLLQYKDIHGDFKFYAADKKNKKLKSWVLLQRRNFRNNNMPQDRVDKLNEINFSWNPKEEQWEQMYTKLVEYKKVHGDCLVSADYIESTNLFSWVRNQRLNYKTNILSSTHISKLNEIGFSWYALEEQWEQMYNQLLEYKKVHGDCLVPFEYQDKELAHWVRVQRRSYKDNNITQERKSRLDNLGFSWDVKDERWEDMFRKLVKYNKIHGNCLVPYRYKEDGELACWVGLQRRSYNNNRLSQDRINKLNELGFSWNSTDTKWENKFNQLVKYKEIHGDCLVSIKDNEYKSLGIWVRNQRNRYNNGKLIKEKIDKLNEQGFNWLTEKREHKEKLDKYHEQINIQWESMYKQLKEYKEIYGNCLVPVRYEKNKKLATWVIMQRSYYKNNELSQERINQLNEVGFNWNPLDDKWESKFKQLIDYKKNHGDFRVPPQYKENKSLGIWVANQRSNYKNNKISQDRINSLNEIGFTWQINNSKKE